ncbi:MAG: amidohydrolase [Longimicrobiales bacterium]
MVRVLRVLGPAYPTETRPEAATTSPTLLERARAFQSDLVAMRRDLHRHPELSFREQRTAAIAAEAVSGLGYSVRTGVGITGVVADLDNGPGPTVALRGDMDALPIQEDADHDYASTVPGAMHACGHDAHTAGLVGAARLLAGLKERGELPAGTVRLLFQPSEETVDGHGKSGAMRMVEDGAMDGVDAVLGLHVGGHLPSGFMFLSPGPVMAGSAEIVVEVRGRSAHAAMPHEGVDAVVLAAQGVMAAQQVVSRHLSPMESGILTFGTIEGGTAQNVLAGSVRLGGTLRYYDPDVKRRLEAGLRGAFEGLEALGAEVTVTVGPGYIPVVNDGAVTAAWRAAAEDVLGPDRVLPMAPMMGAEDFAFLADAAPGAFCWLGAALPDARNHHHPRFDIDESVLPVGAALLARGAVALLDDRA